MSIYRHFKGGLYFLEGYVYPVGRVPNKEHEENGVNYVVAYLETALYEENLESVDIYIVYDRSTKYSFYVYKNEDIDGVMAFYRGLDGRYWLRPKDKFHENVVVKDKEMGVTYEVPRFEKIDGEHLFDVMSEIVDK
jgi:hypothetical protein